MSSEACRRWSATSARSPVSSRNLVPAACLSACTPLNLTLAARQAASSRLSTAIQTLAADFSVATGIDVNVVQVPSDQILEKTILEVRSGGTAYDLFTYTYTRPYTEADLLPDLSPFFADAALADPDWNRDDFVNFEKYAATSPSRPRPRSVCKTPCKRTHGAWWL